MNYLPEQIQLSFWHCGCSLLCVFNMSLHVVTEETDDYIHVLYLTFRYLEIIRSVWGKKMMHLAQSTFFSLTLILLVCFSLSYINNSSLI